MNLIPKDWAVSEVTKKSLNVGVGTELTFVGHGWSESFKVTSFDEDGFS